MLNVYVYPWYLAAFMGLLILRHFFIQGQGDVCLFGWWLGWMCRLPFPKIIHRTFCPMALHLMKSRKFGVKKKIICIVCISLVSLVSS